MQQRPAPQPASARITVGFALVGAAVDMSTSTAVSVSPTRDGSCGADRERTNGFHEENAAKSSRMRELRGVSTARAWRPPRTRRQAARQWPCWFPRRPCEEAAIKRAHITALQLAAMSSLSEVFRFRRLQFRAARTHDPADTDMAAQGQGLVSLATIIKRCGGWRAARACVLSDAG